MPEDETCDAHQVVYLWPDVFVLCLHSGLLGFFVAIPVLPAAVDHPTVLTFYHIPAVEGE